MSRRRTRGKVIQALYQFDMTVCSVSDTIETVTGEPGEVDQLFLVTLLEGTITHRNWIDSVIAQYSQGWELSRMAAVDRNILRLALYELLYEMDTPVNVVVNEAVELAKEFSTEESGKFVNGILGKLILNIDELRQGVKND
ncbi:MAG: nusB [Bacilli bacterium]|nr:nusB [Bacilli bacterium]